MRSLNVGVVGVGHMGEYHVRTYTELQNVNLSCVVDIDYERVKDIASRYSTDPYVDYQEIYDKVECVSIAVPTSIHYEIACQFLERGIHVLLEKPMTKDITQAGELVDLAKKKGVILQIGHVERFNGAVQELKNIVKNPIYIECQRLGPYDGKRTVDTGVILDLLIHDVDIILGLVNSKISCINVAGRSIVTPYEDIVNAQIIFENGCIAILTASRVTENKIRTLTVTQPGAYIYLDYADQDLHIHRQAHSGYIPARDALRYKMESFIERLFIHKGNPLRLELEHFVDCVLNGSQSTGKEDLRSLEVTLEIWDRLNSAK